MLLQEGNSGCCVAFYTRMPVDWTELLANEMLTEHRNCCESGL